MVIGEILKEMQPKVYKELKVKNEISRAKPKKNNETLSENVIKDLMGHSSYRRGKGGIRQAR